ncbi:MAG: 30S ribosome-binding factor RbfA [bacterium]|nr:30S ribosome-binding factor RbfA [bacterium]
MESKRQQKFGKLIQKDLSAIFQKNLREITGNGLATITNVKMSPDLGLAKIYISLLGFPNDEEFFEKLNERKGEVRRILGNTIGKQVRKIPELAFYHDTIEEQATHIDKIIDNLVIPPEKPEDEEE